MKSGTGLAVIGVGQTAFGENFDMTYWDMALEAYDEALADAGIEPGRIEAAWLGTAFPETDGANGSAGSALADALGLKGIPVSRCANFCATGMDAFRNACHAVMAGVHEVVLAIGVEKMRDVGPRESLVRVAAEGGHPVLAKGITAPGLFAFHATCYLSTFGYGREVLARVAVKNHANGARNPKAHFRKEITVEKAMSAPLVAKPLNLYDCCPTTDGAAAAIIARAELAQRIAREPVLIAGLGLIVGSSEHIYYDPDHDFLGFASTRQAAAMAYEQAGISDPAREIDCAEVHDCFTITEILNYEDLGFCPRGAGGRFIEEGCSALGGQLPVNPSGGLKSCGHPIGATGVRMIAEIANQLRGRAGDRQVTGARTGLAHNLGGPGSVASVAILRQP